MVVFVYAKCVLTCLPVKVRICAGMARFGESVGLGGQLGNTRSGQWGAQLG